MQLKEQTHPSAEQKQQKVSDYAVCRMITLVHAIPCPETEINLKQFAKKQNKEKCLVSAMCNVLENKYS